MKTLLILPPSYPGKKRRSSAPPLSLLYLGSFLKSKNYEVSIIDADILGYDLDELVDKILKQKPGVVGLNAMTPFVGMVLNIVKRIKAKNKDIKIVLGGPHVTATLDELLKLSLDVDFLVYGEGEITLWKLLQALEKNESLVDITGLIYRHNNQIIINPPRELISDLNSLPMLDFSLMENFDIKNYTLFYSEGRNTMNMLASRGCLFSCTFCSAHLTHGKAPRFRSPEKVIEEIKMNQKKYDISYVSFKDSTFTMNSAWLEDFCHKLIQSNLDIKWACNARLDTVDEELIALIAQAGCNAIGFGVESGSQRILDVLHKGTKVESIPVIYDWCKKHKVSNLTSMMVGNPTETKEDIEKTYQLAVKINPYAIGFNCLTAFPGTKAYQDALADGSLKDSRWYITDKDEHGDYKMIDLWAGRLESNLIDSQKELERIVKRFYLRPAYVWGIFKHILHDPHLLKYAIFYFINILRNRVNHV